MRNRVLITGAVTCVFFVTSPVFAQQKQDQPHMQAAIEHLRAAEKELNEASPNKGGHREKALDLTKQAISEVEQGIQYADKHPEEKRERAGNDITQQELKNFDQFLDSHLEVRKDLMRNPSLVDDQTYLSSHSGLREFLQAHPGVRQELKENPQAFIDREKQYERSEPK